MPEQSINTDKSQLEGRYANYFEIGHNTVEFLLDFGMKYPENETARIHTRVVTSPAYIRALLETLGGALAEYEAAHGAVARAPGQRQVRVF
jgi:hypothetical protein